MFRYVTAGESHGKQLTVIIEGIPAGLKIRTADINKDLFRRQAGYGRGARMKIEKDSVEFTAGVRLGETIGSPVCMVIKNFDWENWQRLMSAEPADIGEEAAHLKPRPGHADLPGAIKFDVHDIRNILERASARETAARVAAGALCKKLVSEFGIEVYSFVREIGGVRSDLSGLTREEIISLSEKSPMRTPDKRAEKRMMEVISGAGDKGDTVGGVFTVVASGVPVGLGSHTQWDEKLDAKVARALMSIQAIKGVEFGLGFGFSGLLGSAVHDEVFYSKKTGFYRKSNNAGGVEGGISNGEEIVVSCAMKPIPSLKKPLASVNVKTKKPESAEAVRSDVCAVPAAAVIGESALSCELAAALKEKFGGDSLAEMKKNFNAYIGHVKGF
ncbi:MAG: chorismate synthase [Endomicrobiales bacterium]|nr:chorismate synthase [Endomicrobiales bacterium]